MFKRLTVLLLLFWMPLVSQNDSTAVKYDDAAIEAITISQDDLAEFYADDKFDYTIEKVENTWWDGFKNWFYNLFRRFFEWIFGVEEAAGYLAIFLRILPYLLLAVLLFLLVRFFIKTNTRALLYAKDNPNTVSLSDDERIIKTADIQQLIKEAIAHKNYRLAIRYYYLYLLKILTEKELIDWQLQKTNEDYINELAASGLRDSFARATFLYDYIWYGEFQLDEIRYQKAEVTFTSLQKSIEGHG